MTDNYDHSDVMQAVCAALIHGDDGLGKYGAEEEDLPTYHGLTIHVSEGARDLIAEARRLIGGRGDAFGMYRDDPPYSFSHRDIERAVSERTAAIEYLDRVERGEIEDDYEADWR